MNSNNLLKVFVLSGAIVISASAYYYFTIIPARELDRNYRYTAVTIINVEWPSDGPKRADYIFYYDKKYTGSCPISYYEEKLQVGAKIIVKFSPKDPNNHHLIYDLIIPDTLTIPAEGWKELPLGIR